MSILSDFEDRIGSAVEGMFAGVFRAPVQPAELARACAKEMDRRKKLGVGKVYAPTLYSVLLSPRDGDQLGGFADTLAGELATYLVSYAAERNYQFATRPHVRFLIDDGLKLGRFEVIGELLSAEEIAALAGEPIDDFYDPDAEDSSRRAAEFEVEAMSASSAHIAAVAPVGAAGLAALVESMDSPAPVAAQAAMCEPTVAAPEAPAPAPPAAVLATVTVPGVAHDIVLGEARTVIGRLNACDICLPDANVSREHAQIIPEGAGWVIEDLGSTNGTRVNGRTIDRIRLRDGDVIQIGTSELGFHETRG